jgi:predicted peptidase
MMFKEFHSAYSCLFFAPEGKIGGLPFICFLHGVHERGSNLEILKRNGLPLKLTKEKHFPFVVLIPQCPPAEHWEPTKVMATVREFLERYTVDNRRVYLTGLSMGGFGTFATAIAFPNKFAAIAPICGGGQADKAQRIAHVPNWVFHGAKDPVVPISRSATIVEALQLLGASVRFTVYPDGEHDVWTETYDNQELYQWFLQFKLP